MRNLERVALDLKACFNEMRNMCSETTFFVVRRQIERMAGGPVEMYKLQTLLKKEHLALLIYDDVSCVIMDPTGPRYISQHLLAKYYQGE